MGDAARATVLLAKLRNHSSKDLDVGYAVVHAGCVAEDLRGTGLSGLDAREVEIIEGLVAADSRGFLYFDEILRLLQRKDLSTRRKVGMHDKIQHQLEEKERASKEKLKDLHKNYASMKRLEQRMADEARRRMSAPQNGMAGGPGGEDSGDEEVSAVFEVEAQLRAVLDRRRARLLDAYKEIDLEGKGRVSKVDLGKGLHRLGVFVSRAQLDRFFGVLDFDRSGTIEFREFSRLMQAANLKRQRDKMEREQLGYGAAEGNANEPDEPPRHAAPQAPTATCAAGPTPSTGRPAQAKTGKGLDNGTICFQVSDRKLYLSAQDLAGVQDSVLGQAASTHRRQAAADGVFLDLNPDVFEFLVARVLQKRDGEALEQKPGVNVHTVAHMCRTLGIQPSFLRSEAGVAAAAAATAAGGRRKSERAGAGSAIPTALHEAAAAAAGTDEAASACACHDSSPQPAAGKTFKMHLSRTLSSSSEGIEIHVRKNERLVLDSVLGGGQLLMDVYAGDDLELKTECRGQDLVVFDARAYFHQSGQDPIELGASYPGSAHYRLKVASFEKVQGVVKPATLTLWLHVESTFSCHCAPPY